jgi:DNA-binding LacI/PurR family transcriptional regulator
MLDRPVTIREVAADANVGTATVSRALNEPWRVSPATIERVNKSIDKLGYKPNFRARLLARGNSGMICFLLSNRPFIHAVHGQVLQGAAREADVLGVQIVYASCTYEPGAAAPEIELPQILAARGLIDGVIVAGTNYPNLLEAIDRLHLPYVVFGTNLVTGDGGELANAVYVDEQEGARRATGHLLSLGHVRIRFIGDTLLPWYRRRYQGYCDALQDVGIAPLPPVGAGGDDPLRMGVAAALELLDRSPDFTAVFAGSDRAAHGAMKALRSRGVRIPDDISLVGFDDDEIASLEEPPLTTVRMPTEDIGARCVLMLNDMIRTGVRPDESISLPAELVVRESASKATS